MTYTLWIRLGLGYLILVSLQIGLWALFAPRSFYNGFPGPGRAWVSVDGPYNEHLIRDVGALNLALVAVLLAAAITMSRQLITTASVASLVWGTPHLLYHLFNTEGLSASDVTGVLLGLAVFAALPVALIVMARTHRRVRRPPGPRFARQDG